MAQKILLKIWNIFASILAFSFIVFGTAFTYYYANGYRFNPINGEVKQTGVISIQTIPTKSEVFVNEKDLGKSPKVSAVDIGQASVKTTKDGYSTWEKTVTVIPEKSTTLQPTMFLESPQPESLYSIKAKLVKQIPNGKNNNLLLLLLQDNEYRLIKYSTQKSFWNMTENPQILYKISAVNIKKIETQLSPDGKWLLVTKTSTNKAKTYDIVKLDIPTEVIKGEELETFTTDYTISWSENSGYLILESNQDILAYKFSDGTKYFLLKKNPKINYIWTTDSEGFFYYIDKTIEKNTIKFSVLQTTLQGSSKKTLLKDVYLQNTDKYITEIRKGTLEYQTLTNAKENTNFAGDLISFKVFPKASSVVFFTQYASYWYNQIDEKYVMISAWPVNIISLSPDLKKFIFLNPKSTQYGIFTFSKIEADPQTTLGTKFILTSKTLSDITWSNDSQDLFYIEGNRINVIEYDGTNNHNLIENSGGYILTDDLEYLYCGRTSTDQSNVEIIRYRLY